MNKVLIFGINSFSGSHFQKFINKKKLFEKFNFIGVLRRNKNTNININCNISYAIIESLDKQNMKDLLLKYKPEYIINLTGVFCGNKFEDFYEVNTCISRYICEIICEYNIKIKKILLIGSSAEYGRLEGIKIDENMNTEPINFYGLSKLIQTHIAKYYFSNYSLNINIARTFNIIGGGISLKLAVGNFMNQIKNAKNNDTIHVGDLNSKRDYLHIEDVINAYWRILIYGTPGEIYNVCSGTLIDMGELLNILIRASGKIIFIKNNKKLYKDNEVKEILGDNTKVRRDTGWDICRDILNFEDII